MSENNASGNSHLLGRLRRFTLTGRRRASQRMLSPAQPNSGADEDDAVELSRQRNPGAKLDGKTMVLKQSEERSVLAYRLGVDALLSSVELDRIESSVHPPSSLASVSEEVQRMVLRCDSSVFEDSETSTVLDAFDYTGISRVFLSTTYTDWLWERDLLHMFYLPKLRSAATLKGLEFQLIDPNLAVSEAAALSQVHGSRTRQLQLSSCLGNGEKYGHQNINFVGFVGNKYGAVALPQRLEPGLFDAIYKVADSPDYHSRLQKMFKIRLQVALNNTATAQGRQFVRRLQDLQKVCMTGGRAALKMWYALDENSLPAEYQLRPVNQIVEGFNPNVRDEVYNNWLDDHYEPLITVLTAAIMVLGSTKQKSNETHYSREFLNTFLRSVNHSELLTGCSGNLHHGFNDPSTPISTGKSQTAALPSASKSTSSKARWSKTQRMGSAILVLRKLDGLVAPTVEQMQSPIAPMQHVKAAYTDDNSDIGKAAQKKLEALKAQLTKIVHKPCIVDLSTHWEETKGGLNPLLSGEHSSYAKSLCDSLYATLLDTIVASPTVPHPSMWAEHEPLKHVNFVRRSLATFGARHDTALQIATSLQQHSSTVCVKGNGGTGKTMLLCKVVELVSTTLGASEVVDSETPTPLISSAVERVSRLLREPQTPQTSAQWVIVPRFVGLCSHTSTERGLLASLCIHVLQAYGNPGTSVKALEDSLPPGFEMLCQYFQTHVLSLPSVTHPLLLVIDGIDDLVPERDDLSLNLWLPNLALRHVRILVSTRQAKHIEFLTTRQEAYKQAVIEQNSDVEGTQVSTMASAVAAPLEVVSLDESFNTHDAGHMLNAWLSHDQVALVGPSQRNAVLKVIKRTQNQATPLILRVIYLVARHWNSYEVENEEDDSVTNGSVRTLLRMKTPTFSSVMRFWFKHMEHLHSSPLVLGIFKLLAASKDGMKLTELEDILSLDNNLLENLFSHSVPVVARVPTAMILSVLEDASGVIDCVAGIYRWSHLEIAQEAKTRYLHSQAKQESAAIDIADYFAGFSSSLIQVAQPYVMSKQVGNVVWELDTERHTCPNPHQFIPAVPNYRKIRELPHALSILGDKAELSLNLVELMFDLGYLLTSIECGELLGLLNCIKIAAGFKTGQTDEGDLHMLYSALHAAAPVLVRDPRELLSQLVGRLDTVKEGYQRVALLLLQAHNTHLLATAYWHPVLSSLRKATPGFEIDEAATQEVMNKQRPFEGSTVSRNGEVLACGGPDKLIHFWSTCDGQPMEASSILNDSGSPFPEDTQSKAQLSGHRGTITCLSFSPVVNDNDKHTELASGSQDKTVRIWNLQTCEPALTLRGARKYITAVCWDETGTHVAAAASSDSILLWQRETGALLGKIVVGKTHLKDVASIAITSGTKPYSPVHVVSASWDGVVALWSIPRPKPSKEKTGKGSSSHGSDDIEIVSPKWVARPAGLLSWSVEILPGRKLVHVHSPRRTISIQLSSGRTISETNGPCADCLALGRMVPLTSYESSFVPCPIISQSDASSLPIRMNSKSSLASDAQSTSELGVPQPPPKSSNRRGSAKDKLIASRPRRRSTRQGARRLSTKLPRPGLADDKALHLPSGVGYTVDFGLPKRASGYFMKGSQLMACVITVNGLDILEQDLNN